MTAVPRPGTPTRVPIVALRTTGPHPRDRPRPPAVDETSKLCPNPLDHLQGWSTGITGEPVCLESLVELAALLVGDHQDLLFFRNAVPDVLYQPYSVVHGDFTNLHAILQCGRVILPILTAECAISDDARSATADGTEVGDGSAERSAASRRSFVVDVRHGEHTDLLWRVRTPGGPISNSWAGTGAAQGRDRRCIHRYHGNRHILSSTYLDQFPCMALAQLTFRESLRDIEACLRANQDKLYHMGTRGGMSRNTPAPRLRSHRNRTCKRNRTSCSS